jgi:hypothetical protein
MIPYPGAGSGHAGNDTSRERQEIEDASGLTATRQLMALSMVNKSGSNGVTVAEIEEALGVGHGQASSALSHLHRAGKISRLKDRRNKQELYVAPDFINGRRESPYNPRLNRKHPRFYSDHTVVEAMRTADLPCTEPMYDHIRRFLEALP